MRNILNAALIELVVAGLGSAALLCVSSTSAAGIGETVHITVYDPERGAGVRYLWSATGGKLTGNGAKADWVLSGVTASKLYSATVSSQSQGSPHQECTIQVGIVADGSRGDRETGRTLLARNKTEDAGFGLYSYVLFGAPPDDRTRDRFLTVLKEYLRLSEPLAALNAILKDPKKLNANYLPVVILPAKGVRPTAEWLLSNYDFVRSRVILRTVPGSHFGGPYFLSTLKPVDPRNSSAGPILFQDLSSVPLDLITPWYTTFLSQADQERFWEPKTGEQLTLKIRTVLGVLAQGLPDVKNSLTSWIQWQQH